MVVLLFAPAARAAGPAAIDQYIPNTGPEGQKASASEAIREAIAPSAPKPVAPTGPRRTEVRTPAGPVRGPGAGIDEDGGFSLTPFVIIVIVLFLAGLAARYLPRLVRRLRQARPA